MSKLKKIIKQELDGILVKESFGERASAMWNSLNDEGCEGRNRDICKAQAIIGGFLKKLRKLESETEQDIKKLNLTEAPWMPKMFDRYGKIQAIVDHLQAIIDMSPDELTNKDGPDLLGPEWSQVTTAKQSAQELRSQTQAQADGLTDTQEDLKVLLVLQERMKDLFEDLYAINESIINENEEIRKQPRTTEINHEAIDALRESLEEHEGVIEEIEEIEDEYQDLFEKVKEDITKLTSEENS